ncbi:MAG: group III truncated hemoglobin [Chitinophagaceae bacterium]|jgi:hemoglobin|nr:group III truncated hemoglobin [Chitinophagaceae bacterium]MCU0403484.1 group III truncated hemoglobin [Chitinophagaceae bacterium]
MLPDIENRDSIVQLVNTFYEKVKKDELIGPIFEEKVKVNWEKHLPVMYDFWENIVFYTGSYSGNPMVVHKHLHERFPLDKSDFARWLKLFTQTVDDMFSGDRAEAIKQRAISIATVMQIKIIHPNS